MGCRGCQGRYRGGTSIRSVPGWGRRRHPCGLDGRDSARAGHCSLVATRELGQFILFPPRQETSEAEACEEVAGVSRIAPHPPQPEPTVMWLRRNIKLVPRGQEARRGSVLLVAFALIFSIRRPSYNCLRLNPCIGVTDSQGVLHLDTRCKGSPRPC